MMDTTPQAQEIQLQAQRSLGGARRLLLAMEMSKFARELSLARIRQQHPDWTDREQKRELARLAFVASGAPVPL